MARLSLQEELQNPLNGPRPRSIDEFNRKEGRAQQLNNADDKRTAKKEKNKGGVQRRIRKQLVELYKFAAITNGPFKSKLLVKINNLKKLKKNFKKFDKKEIEIMLKENSL